MIRKDDFCKKYNISDKSFKEANIEWTELENICNDYVQHRPTLEINLNFLAESLRTALKVHSIKVRLKDPEHLIEKIIRHKREKPSIKINVNNYRSIITDLVGVRALHLFKEDWLDIHNYIINSWELKSKVVANVREGDPQTLIDLFRRKNCVVKKHPFGYRSVHYIIASKPHKEDVIAEIQVRTIFEEGWSEIDHLIRYPYVHDNPILEQFLVMFNRLAGSADEMGSFVKFLSSTLKIKEEEFRQGIANKSKRIEELKKKMGDLKIKPTQRVALTSGLIKLYKSEEKSRRDSILNRMMAAEMVGDAFRKKMGKTKS